MRGLWLLFYTSALQQANTFQKKIIKRHSIYVISQNEHLSDLLIGW
jgi:hypothetical protein